MNHKFGLLRAVSLTALVVGLSGVAGQAQVTGTFKAGDIVVYRVGDGSAPLTNAATAVFLDEYTTTGALVQSVAITGNGVNNLTASGTATSEGELNVSGDGRYLTLTGYNAAVGATNSGGSIAGSSSTSVPRVMGLVGTGLIDTSTTTTSFNANNIRAAYTTDGSSIYAVGANSGVVSTSKGSGTSTTFAGTSSTNLRDVSASSSGQLYASSGTSISKVSAGTLTALTFSSAPTSAYAFFFASLASTDDTLYIADAATTASNGTGRIDKYSLQSNGSYASSGTISTGAAVPLTGLSGRVSGGSVQLFATSASSIYSVTDSSGYNQTISGTLTTLNGAATNTAIRGIAFLPNDIALPEPGVLPLIAEASALIFGFGLMRRRKAA